MAAPRRRTERSESAAERARKAQRPAARRFPTSLRTFTPRRAHRSAAFRARRTPCRAVFCSPLLRTAGRKKARPAGALFLKGRHKFALWNDTIALRLKKRGAPLFGGGAPKSVGGAKNGFVMRFFALQPFL